MLLVWVGRRLLMLLCAARVINRTIIYGNWVNECDTTLLELVLPPSPLKLLCSSRGRFPRVSRITGKEGQEEERTVADSERSHEVHLSKNGWGHCGCSNTRSSFDALYTE